MFVAAPLFAKIADGWWPRWVRLVFFSPLLLVWAAPLSAWKPGAVPLMWGYYLLASAYIGAYVAAQISPFDVVRPVDLDDRGFPIIERSGEE
jgi:hypothetical protein